MERKADSPPAAPEVEMVAAKVGAQAVEAEEKQEVVLKKGPWSSAEDVLLGDYVRQHGEGNWKAVRQATGLARCGKSCRLRWTNHLRPNLKKGAFSPEEERLIARLHSQIGNKWARIASKLPGRTDNNIKNYWNTRMKRRQQGEEVQLQLALLKRSRNEFSLSPPLAGNVQTLEAANATSARYTSIPPTPLDQAGRLAMANRPVQQLMAPFSAPPSPWASPLGLNAPLGFQIPRSLPMSSAMPNTQMLSVTADLSLGYGNRSFDRSGLPSLSPSLGVKMELPSSQLRPAMPLVDATSGTGMGGGLQGPQNAASLEAMMQELHDAMEDKVVLAEGDGKGHGDSCDGGSVSVIEPDTGNGNMLETEPKDDLAILFGLIPTMAGHEPAPAASNPSGLQRSNNDEGRLDVSVTMDLLLLGGANSTDWNLDQWNNKSGIC